MKVRPLHDRIIVQRLGGRRQRSASSSRTPPGKTTAGNHVIAGDGKVRDDGDRVLDVKARRAHHPLRQCRPEIKLDGVRS
jgi:co-chaperonin GroES (HSP10)